MTPLQKAVNDFLNLTSWNEYKDEADSIQIFLKEESNYAIHCGTIHFKLLSAALEESLAEDKQERCQTSGCDNPADPTHVCPYRAEINDDEETLCNCCSSCHHECLMDI